MCVTGTEGGREWGRRTGAGCWVTKQEGGGISIQNKDGMERIEMGKKEKIGYCDLPA